MIGPGKVAISIHKIPFIKYRNNDKRRLCSDCCFDSRIDLDYEDLAFQRSKTSISVAMLENFCGLGTGAVMVKNMYMKYTMP